MKKIMFVAVLLQFSLNAWAQSSPLSCKSGEMLVGLKKDGSLICGQIPRPKLSCEQIVHEVQGPNKNTDYTPSCKAGYFGASCNVEVLDTNGGVPYHGFNPGRWNADRSKCIYNILQDDVSYIAISMECCKIVAE